MSGPTPVQTSQPPECSLPWQCCGVVTGAGCYGALTAATGAGTAAIFGLPLKLGATVASVVGIAAILTSGTILIIGNQCGWEDSTKLIVLGLTNLCLLSAGIAIGVCLFSLPVPLIVCMSLTGIVFLLALIGGIFLSICGEKSKSPKA